MMPEIVSSMYDRPGTIRRVVRHPDPVMSAEWLAVWNSETGEFKWDNYHNRIKRYWAAFGPSLAGYEASDDDAWFREVRRETPHRQYRPYEGIGT